MSWVAPLVLSLMGSGVTAALKSAEAKRARDEEEKRLARIRAESTGPDPAQLAIQEQAITQRANRKKSNLLDEQGRLLRAADVTSGQDLANSQRNIAGEFADIEQGQLMELAMAGMQEKEREDKEKLDREAAGGAVVRQLESDIKNPYFDAIGEVAQTTGALASSVPEVRTTLMAKQAQESFDKQFPDDPKLSAFYSQLYTMSPDLAQQFTEWIGSRGSGDSSQTPMTESLATAIQQALGGTNG